MAATLPLLLSVPHGGTRVPAEVADYVVASEQDVLGDGDAFTTELYDLASDVAYIVAADVARAFVDLNRAPDDRPPGNPDGVVKTQTVHGVTLYREALPDDVVELLLRRYYAPYHERLELLARAEGVRVGIDCHSMLSDPPPGFANREPRPAFCISNAHGETAPDGMAGALCDAIRHAFALAEEAVRVNDPFRGGHIVRHHARNSLPWLQLEINRSLYLHPQTLQPLPTLADTRQGLQAALERFARTLA